MSDYVYDNHVTMTYHEINSIGQSYEEFKELARFCIQYKYTRAYCLVLLSTTNDAYYYYTFGGGITTSTTLSSHWRR